MLQDKQMAICDNRGKVYVWRDESEPSPIKNINTSSMLELSHSQDDYETFTYTLDCAIGEEDEDINNKVLAFHYASKD